MATGATGVAEPREGSVEGYHREVERLLPELWLEELTEEPADAPPDDDFGSFRSAPVGAVGDESSAFVPPDDDFGSFRSAVSGADESGVPAGANSDGGDTHLLRATPADDLAAFAAARDALEDELQRGAAEERHLNVDAPTEARPGQIFAVHAQLAVSARGGATQTLRPFAVPRGGREVTVDLVASANLAPRGATTARVRVRPGEDSDPVRFELNAEHEGRATIDVRAYAGQQFVGSVHVDLTVHAEAGAGQQRARSNAMLTGEDPHSLTLEIRLDPGRRFYEFQLRGERFVERPVRADAGDLDASVRGLQQQLNDLARGSPPYSPAALQAVLRGQGAAIWNLLPPAVRGKLLDNIGVAERLCVLTEGDPMPWELVYASGAGDRPRGFLSDLFLVTRWQYGASAPLDIGRGERCYVLPPGAPTAAASEIAAVQRHLGDGRSLSRVDDVLAEIDRRQFGLLHFAAHNVPNFARPNATAILLDQPLLQAMVGEDRRGSLDPCAPLVFVNACSSSTPTLLWAGAEGWATRFLVAGAGAFIGTLWEIRDGSAARFAGDFYARLAKHAPVGAAFREARETIRANDDPTWLAYTLYAHPYAHYEGAST